jgi:glucose/arabinose dehydrogenase
VSEEASPGRSRRRFLTYIGGGALGGTLFSTGAARASQGGVTATPVARGFTAPLDVVAPPGEAGRYLVADQKGVIERVDDGTVSEEPYLDVRDRTIDVTGGYSEMGLLGFALHPNYEGNRQVYVRYSAPRRSGTPASYSHTFVLSEFTADGNGEHVDPSSERTLLEIPQPQANHNAGSVAFGPDGFLYVGVGDGGGANDVGPGHVEDWYTGTAGGNGQDLTSNLLGSLLRIDVDGRDGDQPYAIPSDNPLVDAEGFDEHYAWGLRNPWRLSFDGEDLYVADVGQNLREEINRVVKGGNYGWNVREGTVCFDADNPSSSPESCPTSGPGRPDGDEALRDPVIEYSHSDDDQPSGLAVVGGYRYRGDALSGLEGAYLFTDWNAQGRLFVARPDPEAETWPIDVIPMEGADGGLGSFVLGFGRDRDGELLLCSSQEQGVAGSTGAVHRFSDSDRSGSTDATPSPTSTETSGDAGSGFGPIAAIAGVAGTVAWALRRMSDRAN